MSLDVWIATVRQQFPSHFLLMDSLFGGAELVERRCVLAVLKHFCCSKMVIFIFCFFRSTLSWSLLSNFGGRENCFQFSDRPKMTGESDRLDPPRWCVHQDRINQDRNFTRIYRPCRPLRLLRIGQKQHFYKQTHTHTQTNFGPSTFGCRFIKLRARLLSTRIQRCLEEKAVHHITSIRIVFSLWFSNLFNCLVFHPKAQQTRLEREGRCGSIQLISSTVCVRNHQTIRWNRKPDRVFVWPTKKTVDPLWPWFTIDPLSALFTEWLLLLPSSLQLCLPHFLFFFSFFFLVWLRLFYGKSGGAPHVCQWAA